MRILLEHMLRLVSLFKVVIEDDFMDSGLFGSELLAADRIVIAEIPGYGEMQAWLGVDKSGA